MLLRILQMVILSILRYGETAYGSATKAIQSTTKGSDWPSVFLRYAKRKTHRSNDTSRNERTEYGKCRDTILTNVSHPIRHFFCDTKIYDEYGVLKTNTPT
jgi:hypothetical protein